jgi:hypothetical protein
MKVSSIYPIPAKVVLIAKVVKNKLQAYLSFDLHDKLKV